MNVKSAARTGFTMMVVPAAAAPASSARRVQGVFIVIPPDPVSQSYPVGWAKSLHGWSAKIASPGDFAHAVGIVIRQERPDRVGKGGPGAVRKGGFTAAFAHPTVYRLLRPLGHQIRRDCDHVGVLELIHYRLHQRRPGAGASPDLDVVELAIDVHGRAPDDRRNLAEAGEIGAVADGAADGLAARAGGDDLLAFFDA